MQGVEVFPEPAGLAAAAADFIFQNIHARLAIADRFSLVLAGGSTPRSTYQVLAAPVFAKQIDWRRIDVFFGDERCVPPEHPDSNYRMARESLFDHVPIPDSNIHRIRGESPLLEATSAYESDLRRCFPGAPLPSFDLLLLGMGQDGHVASLFPGSAALEVQNRWVAAVPHAELTSPPPYDRVSLTLPAINAAAQVLVLVSGTAKAGVLGQVLAASRDVAGSLPARLVRPASRQLLWMVDQDASTDL